MDLPTLAGESLQRRGGALPQPRGGETYDIFRIRSGGTKHGTHQALSLPALRFEAILTVDSRRQCLLMPCRPHSLKMWNREKAIGTIKRQTGQTQIIA